MQPSTRTEAKLLRASETCFSPTLKPSWPYTCSDVPVCCPCPCPQPERASAIVYVHHKHSMENSCLQFTIQYLGSNASIQDEWHLCLLIFLKADILIEATSKNNHTVQRLKRLCLELIPRCQSLAVSAISAAFKRSQCAIRPQACYWPMSPHLFKLSLLNFHWKLWRLNVEHALGGQGHKQSNVNACFEELTDVGPIQDERQKALKTGRFV